MGLSKSDIDRITGFVRKITRAPNAETIVSETFEVLKGMARIASLRVVYSAVPGRWTDWTATTGGLEVATGQEWPKPDTKAATAFFDRENERFGFVSAGSQSKTLRATLEILVPEVWSALLLRSCLDRAQRTLHSEAELARAALRARDEERRRIARELHDDLGQSLASLKLALKWVEDCIRTKQRPDEVVAELSQARQDIAVMLDKMRDLSHTLHPQILDTLGLVAAVKELAHQASRFSQIRVECRTQGKPKALGKNIEVALYRCCQEAINNAVRHAEASKLMIRVSFARQEVRVSVEDNGKGFAPRALYDSNSRMMSTGFWTIRQRMAAIGAAFRIGTAHKKGTFVELIVPYSSKEDHDKRKNKTAHSG